MKAPITIGMMALISIGASAPLLAGEGKALYENNCTKCHGTDVFTREDRGIKNLEGLKNRVKACNNAIENKLSDDELKFIADYLNREFYEF